MGKPKRSSVFALRARAYAFSELAACGGSQQEKKSFCEDTSRSGKGLPPSALLLSTRTHKPYQGCSKVLFCLMSNPFFTLRQGWTSGRKGEGRVIAWSRNPWMRRKCPGLASCPQIAHLQAAFP